MNFSAKFCPLNPKNQKIGINFNIKNSANDVDKLKKELDYCYEVIEELFDENRMLLCFKKIKYLIFTKFKQRNGIWFKPRNKRKKSKNFYFGKQTRYILWKCLII